MSKKGQSLVEVVVALGILAMVFSGVVTLIVRVVDLELMSRNKTIAVSLAQKTLSENIAKSTDGCSSRALITPSDVIENNKTFRFEVNETPNFNYGNGLDNNNFVEIIVKVFWQEKDGSEQSYALKQVVKK